MMARILSYRYPRTQNRPLVYLPSFMDLIAAEQLDATQQLELELKEAKQRIRITDGKYHYQPSPAYFQYLIHLKKAKNVNKNISQENSKKESYQESS